MRPRLTLPQLWLALAVLLPGLASLLAGLSAVDLAYHLRAGGEMLDGGGLPRVDTYTYTVAGQPWLDQQWAAQVLLAAVWRAAGWTGLVLLRSLLIAAAWAALILAMRRRAPGLSERVVAWLALAAFLVSAPAMALRPQLLGILLFCLTLAVLAGRRRHPRLAWAVPVVVAAWSNMHGSFLLGGLLAGLAWLEDLRDDRSRTGSGFALAAATGLAMLVNPFGISALTYAATLSMNRELAARVTEWQPPSLTDPTGILFFVSLLAVAAVLAWRMRGGRPPTWPVLLGLGIFAGLGLVAARGVAWWPAVAAVSVAGLLAAPEGGMPRAISRPPASVPPRPRAANAVVVAILVLAAVPLLPAWRPVDPGLGLGAPQGVLTGAPSGITGALRQIARATDRLWAPQVWGSWFELALPEMPVAVDSRIELFPAAVWADYDLVSAGSPGWQAALDRHGVTVLVVASAQGSLLAAVQQDQTWRELDGRDAAGSVFVRASRILALR